MPERARRRVTHISLTTPKRTTTLGNLYSPTYTPWHRCFSRPQNFCANPPAHFSNGDDEGSVESGEITSSSPPGKRHRKLPRDDDGDGGVSSSGWAASGFERTYKGRDHAAGDGPGGPGPGRRREVGRGERAWGIEGREERRATERGERTLEVRYSPCSCQP